MSPFNKKMRGRKMEKNLPLEGREKEELP